MTRQTVRILLAFSLAFFIYFIGTPGCSDVHFGALAGGTIINCENSPHDNCRTTEEEIFEDDLDTGDDGYEGGAGDAGRARRARRDRGSQIPVIYDVHNFNVSLGQVDVIFVIDNSSSMAKEHRSLANQFRDFLEDIKNIEYRIAVITTDIGSSPENPKSNQPYQDGRFITIEIEGQNYDWLENQNLGLTPDKKVIKAFQSAITRQETLDCDISQNRRQQEREAQNEEEFGQNDEVANRFYNRPSQSSGSSPETNLCPSHDERGIYALNLAITNPAQRAFFREKAHLMVVILSDEDERSGEQYILDHFDGKYDFENYDFPETLVAQVRDHLGLAKSLSVNSIIIPPGDANCLNEQSQNSDRGQGSGRGYEGVQYARLSNAQDTELTQFGNLLKGNVISICNRDYGNQLQKVSISTNTIRFTLPCVTEKRYIQLQIGSEDDGWTVINPDDYRTEGLSLIIESRAVNLKHKLTAQVKCRKE